MLAIGAHLRRRGACQEATLAARLPRTDALVIGVEAIFEPLVEQAIAGQERREQEGLEEPRGMREVPFRGARIVVRLDDLVLVAQRCGEIEGELPRGGKPRRER